MSCILVKRHFLRESGNFRQGQEVTDSDFPHFHNCYSYNSQKQNPKFFSLKLYRLGVWAQENFHLKQKKTAFSQRWVFKGKSGLRATHEHKVFLRNRKYGWSGPRDYEKTFVQVQPKIVTRSQKHNFFSFWIALGLNIFWGHTLHIDIKACPPRQPLGL